MRYKGEKKSRPLPQWAKELGIEEDNVQEETSLPEMSTPQELYKSLSGEDGTGLKQIDLYLALVELGATYEQLKKVYGNKLAKLKWMAKKQGEQTTEPNTPAANSASKSEAPAIIQAEAEKIIQPPNQARILHVQDMLDELLLIMLDVKNKTLKDMLQKMFANLVHQKENLKGRPQIKFERGVTCQKPDS